VLPLAVFKWRNLIRRIRQKRRHRAGADARTSSAYMKKKDEKGWGPTKNPIPACLGMRRLTPRQPVTPCQTVFALTLTKQTPDPPPARHTKRPPAALKIRARSSTARYKLRASTQIATNFGTFGAVDVCSLRRFLRANRCASGNPLSKRGSREHAKDTSSADPHLHPFATFANRAADRYASGRLYCGSHCAPPRNWRNIP
jgi:hypothetical protein